MTMTAIDPLRNNGKPWSDEDRALLARLYPDESNATLARIFGRSTKSIKQEAAGLGARKSAEYMATGPGQRKPGDTPWNKGKSMPSRGRTKVHQFKPGQKPHTWQPIGSERITKDGYLQRKMTDTGYAPRDWRFVHHLVWEEHTGSKVPEGHALIFRDGDKLNVDPANLELVSRAELMRRNSYHTHLPPELAQIVQLRGALTRKINRRSQTS